jgi:tetratricopeptide (TPR) repeat protein
MGLKTHTSVFSSDVEGERMIRWELANVCKELGHFSEALDYFDRVFSIYDKLGDTKGKIRALIEMVQIYAELNDYKNRINLLSFAEELGDQPPIIVPHLELDLLSRNPA